jgi:transposase
VIKIKFASSDCRVCPRLRDCTHTSRPRRTITIHPQPEHEALRSARQRQSEPEFAKQYGKRAGIEGTISQGVRAFGLRRARYLGQAKTHLQHILIATSMNLVRFGHWLAGEPREQTRQSPLPSSGSLVLLNRIRQQYQKCGRAHFYFALTAKFHKIDNVDKL